MIQMSPNKAGWETEGGLTLLGEEGRFSKMLFKVITDKSRVEAFEAKVTANTKSTEDHAGLEINGDGLELDFEKPCMHNWGVYISLTSLCSGVSSYAHTQ